MCTFTDRDFTDNFQNAVDWLWGLVVVINSEAKVGATIPFAAVAIDRAGKGIVAPTLVTLRIVICTSDMSLSEEEANSHHFDWPSSSFGWNYSVCQCHCPNYVFLLRPSIRTHTLILCLSGNLLRAQYAIHCLTDVTEQWAQRYTLQDASFVCQSWCSFFNVSENTQVRQSIDVIMLHSLFLRFEEFWSGLWCTLHA